MWRYTKHLERIEAGNLGTTEIGHHHSGNLEAKNLERSEAFPSACSVERHGDRHLAEPVPLDRSGLDSEIPSL